MACGGCGSVRGMTKPEVANYIQELIDQQKLQAGINDCDGKALPKGAEVVLCDKLADIICDLINKEKVCFPTIDEFVYDADQETLSLTFGGKEYTTHIKVKGGDVTGEGKNGVYTIYQDGKEVVKIDTGVQDVKIEDGKLKVSKSGGVEKEFDIPMPTVTPTELTDNGDGTGSVKYGDKTLPVMTKPTTATKAEDGVVTITNSNGTEVTMTIPDCPDTLLVDAFDKVEVGYIHSATCDKSELEKDPEPAPDNKIVVSVGAHLYSYTDDEIEIRAETQTTRPIPPDTIISGIVKTLVQPIDDLSYGTVIDASPIENTVAFSAKYSEFPLRKPITPPPSDIGTTNKGCMASIKFTTSTEGVTASGTAVDARNVDDTLQIAPGECI